MLGSRRLALITLIVVFLAAAAWGAFQQQSAYTSLPFEKEELLLDTLVTIKAHGESRSQVEQAVADAFTAMREIDRVSDYFDSSSEVSRVNREAGQRPVAVSEDLLDMIALSQQYARLTEGAFDPTVGAVTLLYDFDKEKAPSAAQIASRLPLVAAENIQIDRSARTVRLAQEGMRLDVGGVAKGFAADRAAAVLRARGISQALVTTGSTTVIIGGKPRRGLLDTVGRYVYSFTDSAALTVVDPWKIAIQHPRKAPGETAGLLELVDRQISTSGDYQQSFTKGERRYHHILDPKTGQPAEGIVSLTVVTNKSCAEADILSTALFVMGLADAIAFVEEQSDVDMVLVTDTGDVRVTSGIRDRVEIEPRIDLGV